MNIDRDLLLTDTEKPGDLYTQDTLDIIHHRYNFSSTFALKKHTLEVGIGSGIGSGLISKSSSSYIGCDLLSENISSAKSENNKSDYVQCDAHFLPFKDDCFDIVIALAMIYYLDINTFLDEIERVLKNKGELFFCTSNKKVPGFVPSRNTTEYFSILQLDNILKERGFVVQFYGAFPVANNNNLFILYLKAGLKNTLKSIVIFLFGVNRWEVFKNLIRVKNRIVKNKIDDQRDFAQLTHVKKLDYRKNDYNNRVIYVHVKKNEK